MISLSKILHGKVLIVDDQNINILLLEQILKGAGYVSITSTMVPVMEGLKEIEPDGYLPVLVITAQPDLKLRAFKSGAKDFISKPFELAEVLARVHNMMEVRLLHKDLHNYKDLLEQRVREQKWLLSISHTLASTLELQPRLILNQLRKIIAYTHGGLFVLEGSSLVTLAMRGTQRLEHSAPVQLHLNSPETLAMLFNKHLPIRIADIWSEDPQAQFLRSLLDDGSVLLEGMQSWMWVPLAVKGRLIGGVGVAETTKNYFTDHHAALGLSVADQAAITMVNAELYGHSQALAVLEERQRLARSLHDAVNQSLFSASLIADVLPRVWNRDQEVAQRSLEDLRRLTRNAMVEMRALLAELRPSTLIDSDLVDLLRSLGRELTDRTNLPVAVSATGKFILPAEIQNAFTHICQEALNNVARHANASQVEIGLKQVRTVIEVCIHDNGQGFDTTQIFSGHYGLSMMRERAEAAGLLLSVTSQPGQGTELTIRWNNFPQRSLDDNLPSPTHSGYDR